MSSKLYTLTAVVAAALALSAFQSAGAADWTPTAIAPPTGATEGASR